MLSHYQERIKTIKTGKLRLIFEVRNQNDSANHINGYEEHHVYKMKVRYL